MSSLVLLARLVLVVIFATAGIAKLGDLQASRDTVEAFGFPRRLARYGGTALPFAELAVAAGLLPTASTRWAAVGALALLVMFNCGVAYALSQGRTPDCNCFGQVSSSQIGIHTLIRNGVFGLVAAFVIWKAPGSAMTAWTSNAGAANLLAALLAVTMVLLAVTTAQFYRRATDAERQLHGGAPEVPGLPLGSTAPDFELGDLDGQLVSRDDLLAAGKPVILIFASPTCGPCHAMMPEVGRWHGALNESITFVVVESGASREGLRDTLRSLGDVTVLVDDGRETAEKFAANATPMAVALNANGTIASKPMPGQRNIESLVRTVLSAAQSTVDHASAAAQPV
jgi:uncharacterized membrane protein YphA (DoxX/SURF4 family)/thiol-disulfide isomerase/thioredoxin